VDVRVDRHGVVGKVGVDRTRGIGIVAGLFGQRLPDPHDHAPKHLTVRRLRVEHAPDVHHAHHACDAHQGNGVIDGYLDEVCAEGLDGVASLIEAVVLAAVIGGIERVRAT
jgi:hypothetical protein